MQTLIQLVSTVLTVYTSTNGYPLYTSVSKKNNNSVSFGHVSTLCSAQAWSTYLFFLFFFCFFVGMIGSERSNFEKCMTGGGRIQDRIQANR